MPMHLFYIIAASGSGPAHVSGSQLEVQLVKLGILQRGGRGGQDLADGCRLGCSLEQAGGAVPHASRKPGCPGGLV